MININSIKLSCNIANTDGTQSMGKAKFKYFPSGFPTPENPLNGYFNYIHAEAPLKKLAQNGLENPKVFVEHVLDMFHQQGILSWKMKLICKKTEVHTLPRDTLKYTGRVHAVQINHGTFNADQIASGDGNSVESLSYAIRVKSSKLESNETTTKQLNDTISHPELKNKIEHAIRENLKNHEPLEIAIQHIETVLVPHLKNKLGENFELQTKLKRDHLFEKTRVMVGNKITANGNLPLSTNKLTTQIRDVKTPFEWNQYFLAAKQNELEQKI